MIEREYYYEMLDKRWLDPEAMAAYLLDEGVLFVTSTREQGGGLGLVALINDYFIPGSDAEQVTYSELPVLFDLYREKKWDGVSQFVASKRNIPDKHWRDKDSHFSNKNLTYSSQ